MRAIVIEQPNDIALRDVETPTPAFGEVRVRSVRAGVCRTDLDIVAGTLDARWVSFPVVPGHEWSGVIDSIGEGVSSLRPGQRVVCEGNIPCLACRRCHAVHDVVEDLRSRFGERMRYVFRHLPVEGSEDAVRAAERASFDPFFTFFQGGVAAFEPGRRAGAVGVSGLPGPEDDALARRAIEAAGLATDGS